MRLTKKQLILNACFCLALLVVIIWALYAEYDRPWKRYQKEFAELEYEVNAKIDQVPSDSKGTARRAPTGPDRTVNIRQIWLPELGVIDRCTTCHQAADLPGFEDLPQPYRTHSGNYIKQHPVEKFGCVVCHEGQGPALTVKAAHGKTENWPEPLLTGVFAQSSCIKCHPVSKGLPAAAGLKGGTAMMRGRSLLVKYDCTGCHGLKGYERTDRIAPALTSIGSKVSREWLTRWLKDPFSYQPETTMPRFRLSDEETGYVADYLLNIDSQPVTFPLSEGGHRGVENAAQIEAGRSLFTSLGCTGCHMINGKGSDFAPDLSDIGAKVNPVWLFAYLRDPRTYDKNSAMPAPAATDNEIRSITAYLMSLKSSSIDSPLSEGGHRGVNAFTSTGGRASGGERTPPESITEGEKLVKEYGCTGCHEIGDLPSRRVGPQLDNIGGKKKEELLFPDSLSNDRTLISWLKLKVTGPSEFNTDKFISKMPGHRFNDKEADSLAAFLAGLRNDTVPGTYVRVLSDPEQIGTKGEKLMEKYNCLGCHKINNTGGDIAPDLTGEAKKSRPEWIFAFLKGPHKLRPRQILKAAMPDLKLTNKEILSIIEYLSFIAGEPYPFSFAMKKDIPPEDIRDGEKLYREIFACSACHTVNGHGGEVGPDHTDLASRLKRPWIERWLKDPQSIKPDVRMPKFTFKDWEFKALTNYIMTLGQYRFVTVTKEQ